VYLEKNFQNAAIRNPLRIEQNLDAFCMRAVLTVSGVGDIAAGITHPGGRNPRQLTNQVLHTPKTATRQNSAFLGHYLSST
jgi:hypothetical protein